MKSRGVLAPRNKGVRVNMPAAPFCLHRGERSPKPRGTYGVTYSTGAGFGLFYFVTAPTYQSKIDTCKSRCRGAKKPHKQKRSRRIRREPYFAATRAQANERSGGIFSAIYKKRPNAPKGTVKPHTQLQIAALDAGLFGPHQYTIHALTK